MEPEIPLSSARAKVEVGPVPFDHALAGLGVALLIAAGFAALFDYFVFGKFWDLGINEHRVVFWLGFSIVAARAWRPCIAFLTKRYPERPAAGASARRVFVFNLPRVSVPLSALFLCVLGFETIAQWQTTSPDRYWFFAFFGLFETFSFAIRSLVRGRLVFMGQDGVDIRRILGFKSRVLSIADLESELEVKTTKGRHVLDLAHDDGVDDVVVSPAARVIADEMLARLPASPGRGGAFRVMAPMAPAPPSSDAEATLEAAEAEAASAPAARKERSSTS